MNRLDSSINDKLVVRLIKIKVIVAALHAHSALKYNQVCDIKNIDDL